MKKTIFSVLIMLLSISYVHASSCKPGPGKEVTYLQGNYQNIGYCDINVTNLADAGCMPTSYAIVVSNLYDSSINPSIIRDDICNSDLKGNVRGSSGNGPGQASYLLNANELSKAEATKYELTITSYDEKDISKIKEVLKSGSMIIASIKCPHSVKRSNEVAGCKYTTSSSGHYIVLSNVDSNNQIEVLNPGNSLTEKGSYDDATIQANVIDVINNGLWKVDRTSTDCSKVKEQSGTKGIQGTSNNTTSSGSTSSGSSNGTRSEDSFSTTENIEINSADKTECTTLFLKSDGSLNDLGESLQSLYHFIKILVPSLVIILTTLDYMKAISSNDDGNIKKVTQRTIKRIVIGLVIFFLPYLLDILFHLFGLYDISRCKIG